MRYFSAAFLILLLIGLPGLILWSQAQELDSKAVVLTARMAEEGGWSQDVIEVRAGETFTLRLTSEDVMHGFAIGRTDLQPIEVEPGKWSEFSWTPEVPGEYTFYCSRWCGPNHWRMTGTLRVVDQSGLLPTPSTSGPPRYEVFGVGLDNRTSLGELAEMKPSVGRGRSLGVIPSQPWMDPDEADITTPIAAWLRLSRDPATSSLSDSQLWDLVAYLWRSEGTEEHLGQGREIYQENCAACHGWEGAGDGVMAKHFSDPPVADFTDMARMATASDVILEGKILRGGMGTGMPYWGRILREDQISALVEYLWSFTFTE